MGKIDELIQQYCPDGVEFVQIKNIAKCSMGEFVHKSKQDPNAPYPVYNGGITNTGFYKEYNTEENKVIVSARGAGAGFVNVIEQKFWAGNSCHIISVYNAERTNYKYLFYALKNIEDGLIGNQQKGGIPAISKTQLETTSIPLPPLPVQEAIVNILDRFAVYAAELQTELQARQQQYNYYRDTLLSFEGRTDVQWKKLGEVGTEWYRGAGIKRDEVSDEGIPCIRYGEIHTTYNIWFDECVSHTDESKQPAKKYADHGDILFAITSEDIPFVGNSVAYLGKERIMVGGDIVVMKHDQDPKYMSYVLSTSNAVMQKGKGKVKSKVVHTNVPSLQEIEVPIPSLEEQRRIADILDNFHTLVYDLSQGLPAEIEARQQQYEYYRDKLLTFKRK